MADDPRGVVELVARESYGRLVAYLSARTRDVAAAEDALSEAFVTALRTWPRDGVPLKPEAWLLTTARRRLIDRARHERVRVNAAPTVRLLVDEAEALMNDAEAMDERAFPDERLKLLFVCAHPDVDRGMHTPLMLQVVLGLDAATIASAFLISPATMGQRLSRAKARIRDAGIPFEIPDRRALPARLEAVLEAIYAAYGTGWDDVAGSDPRRGGLAQEAVWLVRTLLQLLPDEPEARGLLALMLYCEARRPARRAGNGDYVPMLEQDTRLWSTMMLAEAERELVAAAARERAGRFQLEAALQSAHVEGARRGRMDWPQSRCCTKDSCGDADRRCVRRTCGGDRRGGDPLAGLTPWIGSTRHRRRLTSRTGPCARTSCAAPDGSSRRWARSIAPSG